jgi:hypothetical protein
LAQALRIIDGAGQGGIALDALHVARKRPSDAQVRALDAAMVSCVQLCDALESGTAGGYGREARSIVCHPAKASSRCAF